MALSILWLIGMFMLAGVALGWSLRSYYNEDKRRFSRFIRK